MLATELHSVCAAPPAASPVAGTPVTVNFNQFQLGSNDLPLSDQLLAPSGGGSTPEQIHIGLGSGIIPSQRIRRASCGHALYTEIRVIPCVLIHRGDPCSALQCVL